MTKDKNIYNYDKDIQNTLSNWNPEVPDSQIGQDWDKVNEVLPHSTSSFPGSGESLLSSIKSNIGMWITGSAIITTAAVISYFAMIPSESDLNIKSENTPINNIEKFKPGLDLNINLDESNDIVSDHTTEPDKSLLEETENKSDKKEESTFRPYKNNENDDKSETKILQHQLQENKTNIDKTQLSDEPVLNITDKIIAKDEITENIQDQSSETQIINLHDSIVCFEQIKDESLYPHAGSYDLEYRISDGDKVKIIKRKLIVLPPVTASFEIKEDNIPELSFINRSENAEQYEWELENELYFIKEPHITLSGAGQYNFTLKAFNKKGCSSTYSMTYHYSNNQKISVPNIFTPDGDGVNDEFVIEIQGEDYYHLSILNSEGKTVFQSRDKEHVWDGKNQLTGEKCSNGTYYFVLKYRFTGETETNTKTGLLTLIRKN